MRDRRVDDGASAGHGLDLDETEPLASRVARKPQRRGGSVGPRELVRLHVPEPLDPVGHFSAPLRAPGAPPSGARPDDEEPAGKLRERIDRGHQALCNRPAVRRRATGADRTPNEARFPFQRGCAGRDERARSKPNGRGEPWRRGRAGPRAPTYASLVERTSAVARALFAPPARTRGRGPVASRRRCDGSRRASRMAATSRARGTSSDWARARARCPSALLEASRASRGATGTCRAGTPRRAARAGDAHALVGLDDGRSCPKSRQVTSVLAASRWFTHTTCTARARSRLGASQRLHVGLHAPRSRWIELSQMADAKGHLSLHIGMAASGSGLRFWCLDAGGHSPRRPTSRPQSPEMPGFSGLGADRRGDRSRLWPGRRGILGRGPSPVPYDI